MIYVTTAAKAVTALLTAFVAAGVLTGHWLSTAHIVIAVLTGVLTWAVPNSARRVG